MLAFIVIGVTGFYYWQNSQQFESTDNAQLDGNIYTVRASVTAYIDKVYFADNSPVKQGDTLVRFNTVALEARVKQAQAALSNAQASIKVSDNRASASVENASASSILAQANQQEVVAARANLRRAQEEYDRSQKLVAIKAITQQQLETTRSQVEVAQAQLAQALSRQQSSEVSAQGQRASARSEQAQIGTARALVQQRQAELSQAEEDLRHAYVLSPAAGIVTKRAIQTGQYASAGQNLCAVVDGQHLWVSANVKETQLKNIRPGQPADVEVDAYPGLKLKGKVNSFSGATGAKFSLMPPDNATGNFVKIVQRVPVRISLDEAAVRRQMKVDKRGENGKRQFSKLFHPNHLSNVQIGQISLAQAFSN